MFVEEKASKQGESLSLAITGTFINQLDMLVYVRPVHLSQAVDSVSAAAVVA